MRRTHLTVLSAVLLLAPGAILGSASIGLAPPEPEYPVLASRITGSLSYNEPSIDFMPNGRMFVTAIAGLPSRSPIWEYSGGSWLLRGTNLDRNGEIGGGDADLEFDSLNRGYHTDLWLGNDGISITTDGISWTGLPVSHYVPVVDRQWFAHYQDKYLFMVTNQQGGGAVMFRADISGPLGEKGAAMPLLELPLNCRCGPPGFPVVDQGTGILYMPFASGTSLLLYTFAPSTTTATGFKLSGMTVSTSANAGHIFPVASVDKGGNVYIAYSSPVDGGKFDIWIARLLNGTTTWSFFKVNSFTGTHVFPWIVAGDTGKIGLAWYGTSTVGNPNSMPTNTEWRVYYAQSLNANAASPTFSEWDVLGAAAHKGSISTQGLFGSSDRSLGDFMSTALDPVTGKVHMAFVRNHPALTPSERGLWHAEQPAAAASLL